jgi:glutathione S-transferase
VVRTMRLATWNIREFDSPAYGPRVQLVTVPILYGDDAPDDPRRVSEIDAVARFLAERSTDDGSVSPNLMLLGDFKIFDRTDATMAALLDAG